MLASTLGKWLWSWRCQLAYLTPENWRWYLRLSSSSSTPQGGLRLCALCPRAKTAKDYWLVMRLGCQCVIICVAEANSAEERYTNTSTFLSHVVIAHGFPVSNGFGRNLRFLSHSAACCNSRWDSEIYEHHEASRSPWANTTLDRTWTN